MSSNINVLLQNIRSMRENFVTYSLYIASLTTVPDLIFVTEIWIYSRECSEFNLSNYNFRACCNDDYRSGGVGVFLHKKYVRYSPQYLNWTSADVLILDIQLAKHKWTFCCIYRFHNNDIASFCDHLETFLRQHKNKNIVILGDINIDILNIGASYRYQTMLASFGFLSYLNEPTRMRTCLDHVFAMCDNISI